MSATLLDTQVLLWFVDNNPKLSSTALTCITQPGIELFFSHASVWEIVIKYASGKLQLPKPPDQFLTEQLTLNRVRLLPISIGSIFAVGQLSNRSDHKDPFDRLLAAQCLKHDLTLISIDQAFDGYGVRRLW